MHMLAAYIQTYVSSNIPVTLACFRHSCSAAQGAQERIHHFLPVSDFVFADMRAALIAEYSAHLAGESAGAAAAADINPSLSPAAQPPLETCGAAALAAAPMAVSLTACAGEAPRGQLLRQLSPSTPLAVSDDLVMSATACAGKFFEEFPSEIMYYI